MNSQEIKDFYDGFLKNRMLDYRLKNNNLRLARAISRVTQFVQSGETLLDLGCGIGYLADRVSGNLCDSIRIWACDTGPRNIWYASQTVSRPNISFFEADIVSEFTKIKKLVGEVDVVSVIDVIEHIPAAEHEGLFANIASVLRAGSRVVLTYPSPQYQLYLKQQKPEELQVVDEVVQIDSLAAIMNGHGFFLKHFSVEDVWMTNQYVHSVFQKSSAIQPATAVRGRLLTRIKNRSTELSQRLLYPYRKWKYVDKVFGHTKA
jgi:cyclopropane fatty-acyl-phospholipid synthase-like methyltransferase